MSYSSDTKAGWSRNNAACKTLALQNNLFSSSKNKCSGSIVQLWIFHFQNYCQHFTIITSDHHIPEPDVASLFTDSLSTGPAESRKMAHYYFWKSFNSSYSNISILLKENGGKKSREKICGFDLETMHKATLTWKAGWQNFLKIFFQ